MLVSGRHLAQKEPVRRRHVSDVSELKEALSSAESGQSIVLAGTTFELTQSLSLEQSNVLLEGASTESTVLVCPGYDSIFDIKYRNHCPLCPLSTALCYDQGAEHHDRIDDT